MAEPRMSAALTKLARTRGRLPALVTALVVAAVILVQSVLGSIVGWVSSALYERVSFGARAFEFTPWQPSFILDPFLTVTLPFALGVFLSLWLIAPLAAQLTVRFVITRGLLASVAGGVVVLVVALVIATVTQVQYVFDIRGMAHSVVIALTTGVNTVIYTTPVVLLAAVLLWLWLRDHPREYEVSGLIDEL
jgi:hypothetical protein